MVKLYPDRKEIENYLEYMTFQHSSKPWGRGYSTKSVTYKGEEFYRDDFWKVMSADMYPIDDICFTYYKIERYEMGSPPELVSGYTPLMEFSVVYKMFSTKENKKKLLVEFGGGAE